MNLYLHPFVFPFTAGVVFLFVVILYKFILWLVQMPAEDKRRLREALISKQSFLAVKDVISESLLHRKIFRVNGMLGYMHMSLALGWFLLIVVGKLETSAYLKDAINLPHVHVFFRYFFPDEVERFVHKFNYAFIMDALLLFVLTGVVLAYGKRVHSRMMGMQRTTKHTTGDRVALAALWLVFPMRLFAESTTCGLHNSGSFLTHSTGQMLGSFLPLEHIELPAWWLYSIVLGVFMAALPFSRYMHIIAEVPHIFLKHYDIRSRATKSSVDNFQIAACSRCGICIDPCQMQQAAGVNDMQAVYYLRDRRYGHLAQQTADNCLMCGRCEERCPVGIDLNTLRLNARTDALKTDSENRYQYIDGKDKSSGVGKVGYFAGCMTTLSPKILKAMDKIFQKSDEEVWYADKDGGVCCGRPMKLAGDLSAAEKMYQYNKELFRKYGITTLVTSCPICLKVFREDYDLQGIRVIHHSEYILELISQGRLKPTRGNQKLTYHDPCELGRGSGIYDQPRNVLRTVGELCEVSENKENGLCCGSSLGNSVITSENIYKISEAAATQFEATGAEVLVTSCPMCKKSFARASKLPVEDISEVVAAAI